VLDKTLAHKGVYPPINVLPSLSRVMDQGVGAGYTFEDHPTLANQLFASYAKAMRARLLASVVGSEGLTQIDRDYLEFADTFERDLIRQDGPRTLEESMELGWRILRRLPRAELVRLSDAQISRHVHTKAEGDRHA
jgi:V/A-type H+-transporting ATPase subunit B